MNTDALWCVPREWPGETVFIIAGGTSVLTQDVGALAGRRVIVINSSYEVAPFADYLLFLDTRWWNAHRSRPLLQEFKGRLVTTSRVVVGERLLRLKQLVPPPGLTDDRRALVAQWTSLQGAMNLAVHLGAARIVLLGADACRASDGRTHHHSPHKWPNKAGNRTWELQTEQLAHIVQPLRDRGVEVINTSPISRLPWWPFRRLTDFVC